MDTILVVNAGSSSVKFQVFATNGKSEPRRLIKGQMDGIGTRPRLHAEDADKALLIDQSYHPAEVGDVSAALQAAGAWLRETQKLEPRAVGHRVVHGGPKYDRPVLVDPDGPGRSCALYIIGAAPPTEQPSAYPLDARPFPRSSAGRMFRYGLSPRS